MQSTLTSVSDYIASLADDRKKAMIDLRKAILKNLPKGFEERMNYGMIGYIVPHKIYPNGYHCNPDQPLPFIGLASQKNYISFYHMALYEGVATASTTKLLNWFKSEWPEYTKQKLDMGKCCVRMKKTDDLPVALIGELCSKLTPQQWIDIYEKALKK